MPVHSRWPSHVNLKWRDGDAARSLQEIGYSVDLVGSELGQTIRVRAGTTHAEPYFQRVHVRIELAEADGIVAHTRNGKVEAWGVEGAIDIRTTDGRVLVATRRPIREPVTIVNSNGDIDFRVRAESRGDLDFETIGGQVIYRNVKGHTIVHHGSKQDRLLASFNDGDNPIVLRTVDGTIRFVVVADPLAIGTWIFD